MIEIAQLQSLTYKIVGTIDTNAVTITADFRSRYLKKN